MTKTKVPVHKHGTTEIPQEGKSGFDWTGFVSDGERIRINSLKYKDVSLTEAFSQAYCTPIGQVDAIANSLPQDLSIGSTVEVSILSISKGNTVFDTGNVKEPMASAVDLWKYPMFRTFLPNGPVKVKVVDKRKGTIYVDPIRPLVEEWEDQISHPERQYSFYTDESVVVENLRWVPGGFLGDLEIPQVSAFTGQKTTVEAFIPGSQIVLNIERNFENWEGKSVRAFITNQMTRLNGTGQKSIVCSVKRYLENKGDVFKINLFKSWTEDGELWKTNEQVTYDGRVTGVIHSSKKCGVFVELPSVNVTGLVKVPADQLSNYHPGDEVRVKISSFDEIRRYNPITGQLEHVTPYRVENGIIKECNLKPVLEFSQD